MPVLRTACGVRVWRTHSHDRITTHKQTNRVSPRRPHEGPVVTMAYSLDDDGGVGYNVHYNLVLQIPGILAAVSCFTIIATYFLFSDLRKLKFVEIVFYIAVNDFIASVSLAQGVVENGSAACYFQGLATNVNYLSSVFWATVITLQMRNAVTNKGIIKDLFWCHIVCWCFPLLVGLLVFTTNTYGNSIYTWCFIDDKPTSPSYGHTLWVYLSFYAWLYLALLLMVVVIVDIAMRLRRSANFSGAVKSTVQKLVWYPLMYLIVWIPSLLCDIYISEGKNHIVLDFFGSVLPVMQGVFMPIFFFANNPAVRNRWFLLYRQLSGKRAAAVMGSCVSSKRSSISGFNQGPSPEDSLRSVIIDNSSGLDDYDRIIPIEEDEDFCDSEVSRSTVGTVQNHKSHSSRWLFAPRNNSRRSDVSEVSMASASRPSVNRISASSDVSTSDTHNPIGIAEAQRALGDSRLSGEWREGAGDDTLGGRV